MKGGHLTASRDITRDGLAIDAQRQRLPNSLVLERFMPCVEHVEVRAKIGHYNQTGMPFYVGKGLGDARSRIEAGDGKTPSGGTPGVDFVSNIDGSERYLEVRLRSKLNRGAPFQDDGGGLPQWRLIYDRDDVLVGYGGHAVYIVGKRPVIPG